MALLRIADCYASEMVAQVNLAIASLGLLIFDATDRDPAVLDAVEHVRRVAVVVDIAVVQVHEVRAVAIFLSRTPEIRVAASAAITAIVASVADGQHGKAKSVSTIAVTVPAACGLEHLARC